mmetsp:Transcript_22123/g.27137  ORF Transcript_22123/g.27137 Transcript_22123/m.27137 type:complete len:830 (-) Transcript_22123:192-2681(-)
MYSSPTQRTHKSSSDHHGRASAYSPGRYISRPFAKRIKFNELPFEKNARGINTPIGIFFLSVRLTVPLAYIYILLILLRELSLSFPDTVHYFLKTYLPPCNYVITKMQKSSIFVEIWVVIEALFYVAQRLHIQYLQYKDTLEESLSAAPIQTLKERQKLMQQMLAQITNDDPVHFIRGWFFEEELENVTKYDVMDFCAWSMFEGRNQEHLTNLEFVQLKTFVEELEYSIAIHLHGEKVELEEGDELDEFLPPKSFSNDKNAASEDFDEAEDYDEFFSNSPSYAPFSLPPLSPSSMSTSWMLPRKASEKSNRKTPQPNKPFYFQETTHDKTPAFFTNLFENYVTGYNQYNAKIRPLESSIRNMESSIRSYVANKRQQLYVAEETAMAAASNMYEHAYSTFVHKGGAFDTRMKSLSQTTYQQLNDAWNSVGKMTERLEAAKVIAERKKFLQQQNKGYKMLLERIIHSSAVPPRQMVDLMKKITQCNASLAGIENSAMDSFLKLTGFAKKHLLHQKEPQRYAKYSEDELLGLATYPLAFNLLIFGLTDGLLRVVMARRGFQRLNIGTTVYYYHRGHDYNSDNSEHDDPVEIVSPIVFCHGIGVGQIYYLEFIDELLKSGRPLFLPEIPYVCGFRPWMSRKSILTPPAVVSTLTAMLASHGHMKAHFVGHSYGTSWLSYMCKYAKDFVASVLFLDPICFCLHHPCLTKSFVYHRADPGSISYMIRTDVIINWTIQRSFPWSRIILFVEDIPEGIPCSIGISELDALIPVDTVTKYFESKNAYFCDEKDLNPDSFKRKQINITVFRGDGHGDWSARSSSCKIIGHMARVLTEQV